MVLIASISVFGCASQRTKVSAEGSSVIPSRVPAADASVRLTEFEYKIKSGQFIEIKYENLYGTTVYTSGGPNGAYISYSVVDGNYLAMIEKFCDPKSVIGINDHFACFVKVSKLSSN